MCVSFWLCVVPDMSVQGTLSTLAATIDLQQYLLIKGLLSFNIGECLDDITPPQKETQPPDVKITMQNLY